MQNRFGFNATVRYEIKGFTAGVNFGGSYYASALGSGNKTSYASKYRSKMLPQEMPVKLPTHIKNGSVRYTKVAFIHQKVYYYGEKNNVFLFNTNFFLFQIINFGCYVNNKDIINQQFETNKHFKNNYYLSNSLKKNPLESRKEWMMNIFRYAGQNKSNNKDFQFWQQNNHPIELFCPLVTFQKIDYIHNNPVVAGIVSEADHYLHSSAGDYLGIKGVLEVEILERPMSLEGYIFSS